MIQFKGNHVMVQFWGIAAPSLYKLLEFVKLFPPRAAMAITDFPSPRFIFECLATQAIQIFQRAGNPIAEI